MRAYDWLIVAMIFLPPLLYLRHGRRLVRRGVPAERIAGATAAYGFTAMLPLIYAVTTDLPRRLEQVTGVEDIGVLTFFLPMWLTQFGLVVAGYQVDRLARQTTWTFVEYLRQTSGWLVLMVAFMVPPLLLGGLLDWPSRVFPGFDSYTEQHPWIVAPGVGVMLLFGGLTAWGAWRWVKPSYMEVEPELAGRLQRMGEALGVEPVKVEILPTRGGRVANAYIAGMRRGRQRLLLTDYLLDNLPPEEVEMVVAHEMGHARLGHVRTRLFLSLGAFLVTAAVSFGAGYLGKAVWHLQSPILVLSVLPAGFLPFLILIPAMRRQELAADRWAAEATGNGAVLAAALERLDSLNRVDLSQQPRWFRLMIGYPITTLRAKALRELEAKAGASTASQVTPGS